MKKALATLCLIFYAFSTWAAVVPAQQQQFRKGTKLLLADQPGKALAIFDKLKATGFADPELLCNIGNAYYKIGRYGKAIACYEKAMVMAPRDTQLLHNRAIVINKLTYPPASVNSTLFKSGVAVAAIDNLLIFSVVVLLISGLLFIVAVSGVIRSRKSKIRTTAMASLVTGAILLILSYGLLTFNHNGRHLVVTTNSAISHTGPSVQAKKKGALKEGDHIQFDEFYKGWYKFSIDGSPAWVDAHDVEAIE